MISTLKKVLRPFKNTASSLYRTVFPAKNPTYHKLSYSHEGEDMLLARIFMQQNNGFYVDIGAYHPQSYSNTYYFYLQGWKGINIDAMPGSMEIFKKIRPNDINLEIPISDSKENLTYYTFNYPNLNGFFSKETAAERNNWKAGDWEAKITSKIDLQTFTLSEVLDKYLPVNQNIDFLNIDVEGLDYQVLKSNDWKKYRPKIVLIEDLEVISISKRQESAISLFMYEQGYQFYGKGVYTLIFKREDFQIL